MHSPLALLSLLSIFSNSLIHANPLPLPLPLPLPVPEPSAVNATAACTDIRIITARASTEMPGEGIIGSLASAIQLATSKSVTRTSVSYPALLEPYAPSVASGVAAMKADIIAAVDACPSQKIVLLGYSQGAECISDTLGGGGGGTLGTLGTKTPAIDSAYGSHVKAAVMMGDPRYMVNQQSFHVGTCFQNGLFPRSSDQSLTAYSSIVKSYCDFGDPFCCSGLDTLAHLTYVTKYQSLALSFVMGKIA